MKNIIYLLFVYWNVGVLASVKENVFVKVNGSIFIGKKLISVFENNDFIAFWKIPYAEPPLRENRFKPPKLKKWRNGTFDYSNIPIEMCGCYNEDRLYLSVYTPAFDKQSENLPVLVWLQGNQKSLIPDSFIEQGVVVVTVTYRKGIFGFLNTGDDFAEGNMGAKDVLLGLKWVNNYIRFFSGAPTIVTVVGARTAATIAASLLLTPAAESLFKRLIVMSGSALSPADYRNYNFDVMNKLYWNLHGPFEKLNRTNLYEMLTNYSTGELMVTSQSIFDSTEVRDSQRLINAFGPSVEHSNNAFIKKTPLDVYEARLTNNNVDLLMGYTSLESLYKLQGFAENKKLLKHLNYNFQYLLPFEGTKDVYESKRYRNIRSKIMDFYFVNGTIGERSLRRYAKYVSDQVIYPLVRQARLHAQVSCTNVYLYRFSFKGLFNEVWDSSVRNLNWTAATSGDELCYLFRCKSVNDLYNGAEASDERHFIRKIARLLANFAKCGNPTPDAADDVLGDLKWEPLRSRKSLRALNLSRNIKMVNAPEDNRVKFWDQLKSEFFAEKFHKGKL